MSIFIYNQKPVHCVVFLKFTGCCAHLISYLGRSDLRGLTCTGSEVVRKYTWHVPPVEPSRVALLARSSVAALQEPPFRVDSDTDVELCLGMAR